MGAYDDLPAAAPQQSGGGGGAYDDLPVAKKREVGVGEVLTNALPLAGARFSRAVGMPVAGAASIADSIASMFAGRPVTGAQDFAFGNFVKPWEDRAASLEVNPKNEQLTSAAKVVKPVADVAAQLPYVIPASRLAPTMAPAVPVATVAAPTVAKTVASAAREAVASPAVQAFALPNAINTATDVAKAGVDKQTAGNSLAAAYVTNLLAGAAPISVPGGVVKRAVSGAAVNVPQGAVAQQAQNVILGDQNKQLQQDPMSSENLETSAAVGAFLAALLGPRAHAPVRSRESMGYDSAETIAQQAANEATSKQRTADFETHRGIMEANGIMSPDDPRAAILATALNKRAERQAELRPGEGEFVGNTGKQDERNTRAKEQIQSGDMHPAAAPWVGRREDAPPPVIELGQSRVPMRGEETVTTGTGEGGVAEGVRRYVEQRAGEQQQAERAMQIAENQAARKQTAVEDIAYRGEKRDLRDASAGGTMSKEGTAATAPEQFTFFDAKLRNGQMSEGERVEVVQRGVEMQDENGKKVAATVVRFPDREGSPEMPVPNERLTTMERRASPRYAQDIAAKSYAPPRGVGTGEQQPQPRRAAQRITTTPPKDIETPPHGEQSQQAREGQDVTDLAFDRINDKSTGEQNVKRDEVPALQSTDRAGANEQRGRSAPEERARSGEERTQEHAQAEGGQRGGGEKRVGVEGAARTDEKHSARPGEGGAGQELRGRRVLTAEEQSRLSDQTVGDFEKSVTDKYPGVRILMTDKGDHIYLDLLRLTSANYAGKGLGQQALGDIINYAHATDRPIELMAMPLDVPGSHVDAMPVEKLVELYGKQGFVALPGSGVEDGYVNMRYMPEVKPSLDFTKEFENANHDAGQGASENREAGGEHRPVEGSAEAAAGGKDESRNGEGVREGIGASQREGVSEQRPAGEPRRQGGDVERGKADVRSGAESERGHEQSGASDGERSAATGVDKTVEQGEQLNEKLNDKSYGPGTLGMNPVGAVVDFAKKSLGWAIDKDQLETLRYLRRKATEAADPKNAGVGFAKIVKAVGYSVDGQFRSLARTYKEADGSPNKIITNLADMFSARPGAGAGKGETYGEAVDSKGKMFENRLFEAFGDELGQINDRGEQLRKQLRNLLVNRSSIRKGTMLGDAATKIAGMLDDALAYAKESGLKIGDRENYFPRIVNADAAMRDPVAFKKAAESAYRTLGMSAEEAKRAAENWHRAEVYSAYDIREQPFVDLGNSIPNADFVKSRQFGKEIDKIMEKFYVTDPAQALLTYFRKTVRRAEWERRLGGTDKDGNKNVKYMEMRRELEKQAPSAVHAVDEMVRAASGELPSNVGQSVRNVVSWTRAITVIHYLGHAAVSSLSEPILASRFGLHGVLRTPKVYVDSFRAIANRLGTKDADIADARRVAEMFGIVVNHYSESAVAAHRFNIDSGQAGAEFANRISGESMKWSGLHDWTQSNRIAMFRLGDGYVRQLADMFLNSPKDKRMASFELRDMGIPQDKIEQFSKWAAQSDKTTPAMVEAGKKDPMMELMRQASVRMVNNTIINPTHADKPYLASHPVASVAYNLTGYLYGFHQNVLKRWTRMAMEGANPKNDLNLNERAHMLAPMLAAPLIVAAQYALMSVRDLWSDPERTKNRSTGERIQKALSYSSLLGAYDPLFNIVQGVRYERDLANALVGPYGGDVLKMIQDMVNTASEKNSPNTNTHERLLAKDLYNVMVDPALKIATLAAPIPGAVKTLITQALSTHAVREQFVQAAAPNVQRVQNLAGGKETVNPTGKATERVQKQRIGFTNPK